jgi:RNA polymerase sigma-70 factor (ECF subfamily)
VLISWLAREFGDDAETLGLLALMLLQDARRAARVDPSGALITLEEQDRTRWDSAAIAKGVMLVEQALRLGHPGPYQIQAAIAAIHDQAPTAEETDWPQIAALYGGLLRINPSPIIQLNLAVAIAMADGPRTGLRVLDQMGLEDTLEQYHLYHAARADLLRRVDQFAEAAQAYRQALDLCQNVVERAYLLRRLNKVVGYI